MLLMQAARDRSGGEGPRSYRFRGLRPLFHFDRLSLQGQGLADGTEALATVNGDGLVCMQADITW
jgi:3-methylfumaryl-CoA hydratase